MNFIIKLLENHIIENLKKKKKKTTQISHLSTDKTL